MTHSEYAPRVSLMGYTKNLSLGIVLIPRLFRTFVNMKPKVRHQRLQMFYESVAMNFASIGAVASLLVMDYSNFNLTACVCGALFLGIMAGYTIWYWTGSRKSVEVCPWLSDVSPFFVIYFMAVAAMRAPSEWWTVFGVSAAVLTLMIYLLNRTGLTQPETDRGED